jgi:hypothetical protein
MTMRNWMSGLAVGCLVAGSAMAQQVISAKSGLVHYTEGEVFIGEQINPKVGEYPEVKEGEHLTTKAGRVEVLLTPGVILRLAENSDMAMISNKLSDTRVEIAGGSGVLEANDLTKETSIQVLIGGTAVEIRKPGVYRFDAGTPPRVRVYDGEAAVLDKSGPIKLKEGKQMLLTSVPAIEKLPKDDSDSFLRWVSRRSGILAMVNYSAANYMRYNDVNWSTGGWYFNPMMGMFTYIPYSGRYRNYWDYAYYSPRTVAPPDPPRMSQMPDGFSAMSNSVRGMQDSSGRSYSGGGYSSPVYQAPATASAPAAAPSAGDGRGASGGGSRGGSGGGR